MPSSNDLKIAFAGESQANRRYLAFASRAEVDGKHGIARLFRAAAEAEAVHAQNHLNVLGEVKPTDKNLEAAIKGENYEHVDMYPKFIETAKKEGNQDAARTFHWANEVEKIHEGLFKKALDAFKSGRDISGDIWVCPVCGNTFLREAPGVCPICSTLNSMFRQFK